VISIAVGIMKVMRKLLQKLVTRMVDLKIQAVLLLKVMRRAHEENVSDVAIDEVSGATNEKLSDASTEGSGDEESTP